MESNSIGNISQKELNIMNNGIRKLLMRLYEFPRFTKLINKNNIQLENKIILDAGCGNGYSTKLIRKKFNPCQLDAFDILPSQIVRAKNQNIDANFFVADVTHSDLQSEYYDATFIFGILHHVPQWQKGITEIARILKPSGYFLLEEPTPKILDHVEHHHIMHPKDSRFSYEEMRSALESVGFRIVDHEIRFFGILMFIIAQKQ